MLFWLFFIALVVCSIKCLKLQKLDWLKAAKMNDRITQLDAQQRQGALKIELLQAQNLTTLNTPQGNTAKKGLHAEITK